MPSNFFFFTKYLFRALHMASFGVIFGHMILDQLFGKRILADRKGFTIFFVSSCVVLMASGLINMLILIKENKFVRNQNYEIWKKLLIFKFFLSFSLTPLLEKLIPIKVDESDSSNSTNIFFKIRLGLVLLMFLMSPFLRFFREYYLKKQTTETVTSYIQLSENTKTNTE